MSVKPLTNIVKLLHDDSIPIEKKARDIYDFICDRADELGLDVPLIRRQYGYKDTDEDLMVLSKGIYYKTKSKILNYKFCNLKTMIGVLFGIRGADNVVQRQGRNEHTLIELIYSKLDRKELINQYKFNKSIHTYVLQRLKDLAIELIGGNSFEEAMQKIDNKDGERDHYTKTVDYIATRLNNRFIDLVGFVGISKVCEYFFPLYLELELYDYKRHLHGLVDSIYKDPIGGGLLIVDNKFGKAKEKYYLDQVNMELWFYKWQIESDSAYFYNQETKQIEPWKPKFCSLGEMWYVLDTENGVLSTKFDQKDEFNLIQLSYDYWNSIDTMNFKYNPILGYRSSRYKKICNARKDDGTWVCEFRPICERLKSFRAYIDSITLMDDDKAWD